jgi:hypothetical protein
MGLTLAGMGVRRNAGAGPRRVFNRVLVSGVLMTFGHLTYVIHAIQFFAAFAHNACRTVTKEKQECM